MGAIEMLEDEDEFWRVQAQRRAKQSIDYFESLNAACKQGNHVGLKILHAERSPDSDYTEWLEDRISFLTELFVDKISALKTIDAKTGVSV